MLMLVSIAMFAFPSRLPASRSPTKIEDSKKPSLRGEWTWYINVDYSSFRILQKAENLYVAKSELCPFHIKIRSII